MIASKSVGRGDHVWRLSRRCDAAGDPVSTDVLRAALMELAGAGETVLFSTHLVEQAERICERVRR